MRALCLALVVGSCSAVVWPFVDFSPRVTTTRTRITNGMKAWTDIATSKFLRFPDFMLDDDYRAFIVDGTIPEGTTIKFKCPANVEGEACDFYVFVDHCPPCALHGGLPGALLSTGWVAGSCAPSYKFTDTGDVHTMAIFRKQVAKGETATVETTSIGRLVGFAGTPVGSYCAAVSDSFQCTQEPFCAFVAGSCVDSWCPRRNAALIQCDVCADVELEKVLAAATSRKASLLSVDGVEPVILRRPDEAVIAAPSPPAATTTETPTVAAKAAKVEGETHTVQSFVSSCSDDVAERGVLISYEGKTLEFPHDSKRVSQMVGTRFSSVAVPKGALIVDARVTFKSAGTHTGTTSVSLSFDKTSSSAPWSEWGERPSEKMTGAAFQWDISENWEKEASYETPNVASHLQEVLDSEEWKEGNAVSMIMHNNEPASSHRSAYSCDSGKRGVSLKVTFVAPKNYMAPSPAVAVEDAVEEPSQCPQRVRKAFSSLTCAEKEHFAAAVSALKQQRPMDYERFVDTYEHTEKYSRGTSAFLSWNRWFLVQFENAVRELNGFECMTLPYWDWEKDDDSVTLSAPLRNNTFGTVGVESSEAQVNLFKCVSSGVAKGWSTGTNTCVKRSRSSAGQYAVVGEMQLAALITSFDSFKGFAPRLASGPDAGAHHVIGGHMASSRAPEDPLFWIHRANVDRIYALWQDFHGYSDVKKSELGADHYQPFTAVNTASFVQVSDVDVDSAMPFSYNALGDRLEHFRAPVSIRDTWDIRRLPSGNSYTYGVDSLAKHIGSCKRGFWSLVVPGSLQPVFCCGDGVVDQNEECDDGNTNSNDGCSSRCMIEMPGRSAFSPRVEVAVEQPAINEWVSSVPSFSDKRVQEAFESLLANAPDTPKSDMFTKLAKYECTLHASMKSTASQAWQQTTGTNPAFFTPCGFLN
eukprot:gene1098-1680_t